MSVIRLECTSRRLVVQTVTCGYLWAIQTRFRSATLSARMFHRSSGECIGAGRYSSRWEWVCRNRLEVSLREYRASSLASVAWSCFCSARGMKPRSMMFTADSQSVTIAAGRWIKAIWHAHRRAVNSAGYPDVSGRLSDGAMCRARPGLDHRSLPVCMHTTEADATVSLGSEP